jgi:MFS family permease
MARTAARHADNESALSWKSWLPESSYKRTSVFLLAGALALDHADRATIGAIGPALKHAFGIHNTQLGLLAGAFSLITAVATIPVGILTDRARRTLILGVSIAAWSTVMIVAGAAASFLMLFCAQMLLGIGTAAGAPTIASLTGDLFPPERRGRILGVIESGELVGTAAGFVLAGLVASALSWRWSFWLLALPGYVLTYRLLRFREPPRHHGNEDVGIAKEAKGKSSSADRILADRTHKDPDIEPDPRNILRGNQSRMPARKALRYVIRVRTNVILIIASSFGFAFFAIIRTFGVVFFLSQYHTRLRTGSMLVPIAAVGAIFGILAGGRIGDRLIRRGVLNGRVWVPAVSFIAAGFIFVPALLVHNIWIAAPFYVVGGAFLSAPNPPLDAARLDVIHPQLWGRNEAVRTMIRAIAEATAPVTFGFMADHIAGGGAAGLQASMLIILPTLLASGVVLLFALRTYPRDVAAVVESGRHARKAQKRSA